MERAFEPIVAALQLPTRQRKTIKNNHIFIEFFINVGDNFGWINEVSLSLRQVLNLGSNGGP